MHGHWRPEGYTAPNTDRYPFAWLWDSCFHAVIWAELGDDERALTELTHVFRLQDDDGFVPHIDYEIDPGFHADFWGREAASTITQPPMYGHAVAELVRRGIAVPTDLRDRAVAGCRFFLTHRRHDSGLVAPAHPWETGCDDSPRWDHWGAAEPARWYDAKGEIVRGETPFDCGSVALTALVAYNLRELGEDADADELATALRGRWDGERRTWIDAGESANSSGRTRTLEALLPALVLDRPEALAETVDAAAFGGRFGPAGVHRAEPSFDRRRYWRGPVWPQLAYLLWLAGADIAAPTVTGASSSALSEYWDPDDGTGLGGQPQSWTGLALMLARAASNSASDRTQ
jgi:hypothetical protein